jgi:hypothetical protein
MFQSCFLRLLELTCGGDKAFNFDSKLAWGKFFKFLIKKLTIGIKRAELNELRMVK